MKFIINLVKIILVIFMFVAQSLPAAQSTESMFLTSDRCMACHNGLVGASGNDASIGISWRSSMMANSSRDPYWQAAVRREIIDHAGARDAIEDKCASCHMPMTRFISKTNGIKGTVFNHLPITLASTDESVLAADGVSCTMCHQIAEEKLGTEESFTAGFVVDAKMALGERAVYGPFDVDTGRKRVMQSSALFVPTMKDHLQKAAFCASCHTLYTHALGPNGQVVGELPEQVPYLEWLHSSYRDSQNCQSCHMPVLGEPTEISSVLGVPRKGFSQHIFRGGNFFMPKLFNRYRIELGMDALPSDLTRTTEETIAHLQTKSSKVVIKKASFIDDRLRIDIAVKNLAGHKLPTAYPSRRVWLNLTVRDRDGLTVFTSGKPRQDGSIEGNDNDADPKRYEPHYTLIKNQEEVQIYEAIMEDHQGQVTTSLLSAVRFTKDNRLLPRGFDKKTAGEDIAIRGVAAEDTDFGDGGDSLSYTIEAEKSRSPYYVEVMLRYQPIAFRWAQNLSPYKVEETKRFIKYYEEMTQESNVVLAQDQKVVE